MFYFALQPCDGEMIILLHFHLKVCQHYYCAQSGFELLHRTASRRTVNSDRDITEATLAFPRLKYLAFHTFIEVSRSYPSIVSIFLNLKHPGCFTLAKPRKLGISTSLVNWFWFFVQSIISSLALFVLLLNCYFEVRSIWVRLETILRLKEVSENKGLCPKLLETMVRRWLRFRLNI